MCPLSCDVRITIASENKQKMQSLTFSGVFVAHVLNTEAPQQLADVKDGCKKSLPPCPSTGVCRNRK